MGLDADVVHIGAHGVVVLRVVEQEGVVSVLAGHFYILHVFARGDEGAHEFARAFGGKPPIGAETGDKVVGLGVL